MPFVKVSPRGNTKGLPLIDSISITPRRITIAGNLATFIKDDYVQFFIDKENKLLGLKSNNSGFRFLPLNKKSRIVYIRSANLNLREGCYPAKWSKKHQMIIAEIEFNE